MSGSAKKCVLVTGGMRSGKSRYSLDLASNYDGPKIFLATAQALDENMADRIARHQAERGDDFQTIEESIDIGRVIQEQAHSQAKVMIIDCLTLWMSNLLHHYAENDVQRQNKMVAFLKEIQASSKDIIIVTNEVGLGVHPINALARKYVDELGLLNQKVAAVCDDVVMVVSGLPQYIKNQ